MEPSPHTPPHAYHSVSRGRLRQSKTPPPSPPKTSRNRSISLQSCCWPAIPCHSKSRMLLSRSVAIETFPSQRFTYSADVSSTGHRMGPRRHCNCVNSRSFHHSSCYPQAPLGRRFARLRFRSFAGFGIPIPGGKFTRAVRESGGHNDGADPAQLGAECP